LSYEYGVPFQSIVELPRMAFEAHVEVLKDIAKERTNANRSRRSGRS
jgi:hypothetical protein